MNKKLLFKLLCLALACVLLLPLVMACGEDNNGGETEEPEEETVVVTFNPRGGDIISGKDEVEIVKGSKLRESKCPEVERNGYTFQYWAYDSKGESEWYPDDKIKEDTDLYAIWKEKTAGGNEGGNEDDNGDEQTPGGDTTVEKITIRFNTGVGYFEDNKYTYEVDKDGYFNGALPTPVCDNVAMKFEGWFWDETWTKQVSRSDVYSEDVVIFAYWTQMTPCKDGSFDHIWTGWDDDKSPTCTTAGTKAQYCQECNAKNTMPGEPATGHAWPDWQEGFLQRERTCRTLGCGAFQSQKFENITLSTLGNNPAGQVKLGGTGSAWGGDRVGCVVDGVWDHSNEASFDPKGDGSCIVTITLLNPAAMDRIYVKGYGADSAFKVMVQYEGESDYSLAGMGSFLTSAANADKENRVIPYVGVDNTRKIVSVQVILETPSASAEFMEEVAFIVIPPIAEE